MPYENLYQSLALEGDLIFAISPRDASLLIALDNDVRDPEHVEAELPNDGDWIPGMSPFLEPRGHLKFTRDQLEKGLLKAVESGRIKAVAAARNVDGRLDPYYSLLAHSDVRAWCDEHDLGLGDWWNRQELDDNEFAVAIADKIVSHRMPDAVESAETGYDENAMDRYQKSTAEAQESQYREMLIELRALKNKIASDGTGIEEKINTREKNSLLTVIAALVTALGDRLPGGYKRAQAVALLTDQIGASVSVNTIDKILKQTEAAVDRRREANK